ncbi:MAG TPA: glycosyltransferase family 39 protein [Gemmatimonadaceae bacterium]|nr:glycosyltransferase family 39 protein [Gemmatimonadaceae bacterium]
MTDPAPHSDLPSFLENRPRTLLVVLVVMFAVAAGVRLMRLDAPGVLVDRDYTSAMLARAYYLEGRSDVPQWRREMASELAARQPILEPPVTEWMASILYRIAGREDMRLGRILAIGFWLVGGVFLFQLARRLVGTDAAVLALGYYLFLPLAVLLSRSFQADALMMTLFVASLLAIVRHHEAPSGARLVIAGIASGLTLLYRPLVMPALVLAWVVPEIQRAGWRGGLWNRSTVTFVVAATVPAFAYYGYGVFIARYFQWKLTTSFMFSLYAHREYWQGWLELAVWELGLPALLLASVGVAFVRRGLSRSVLVGLALGYLCFGLAFTFHIHTHGYYQAQLIPAVAIAASAVTAYLIRWIARAPERWLRVTPVAAAMLLGAAWWLEIRQKLAPAQFESPRLAAEIGSRVGHSERVVFLSRYYGLPLQYLGEFTGAYWPRSLGYWLYRGKGEVERSVAERLAALGFEPEYFVITDFREYETHHADLRAFLEARCSPVAITDTYRIYGECDVSGATDGR